MDSYEATKVVFSRIQALDPENASKIMGFIFIQDPCEKEMIRLAFGPETILISLINQAKTHLGISSNTSSASSPRLIIPTNTVHVTNWSPPYIPNNNNINNPFSLNDDLALQIPDQLDSPPIMSPSGHSDSIVFPSSSSISNMHKRSFSVNDVYMGGEEGGVGGFGWRPCMYYARGFCKNGGNCKFLHGGGQFGELPEVGGGGGMLVGSPSNLEGFDELLRLKALQQQQQQQQRLSQMMAGGVPFNKGINFMNDSPRSAAAALMMGEELHKFGRSRSERSDFSAMGFGGPDSSARQIYLTFPADSTFKEDDVSNYFCKFGPVHDVRIPYQQKRMFGFVTFLYPETVKMILAKGNPHFVCDSRVLVKPYKEKGKIPEKRQHQHQFERGDFAACLSPTGLESQDSYDFPIGPRMLYNNQEMLRRKLEQAEFQQALELQGRRLMNLQLMDLKNHQHHHQHAHQFHHSISPPVQSHFRTNPSFLLENSNLENLEDNNDSLVLADEHDELHEVKDFRSCSNADANGDNEDFFNPIHDDLHESLEHILPDNLFASPTKSAGENGSVFFSDISDADNCSSVVAAPSSTITSPSLESRYLHVPKFSSGQETVEM